MIGSFMISLAVGLMYLWGIITIYATSYFRIVTKDQNLTEEVTDIVFPLTLLGQVNLRLKAGNHNTLRSSFRPKDILAYKLLDRGVGNVFLLVHVVLLPILQNVCDSLWIFHWFDNRSHLHHSYRSLLPIFPKQEVVCFDNLSIGKWNWDFHFRVCRIQHDEFQQQQHHINDRWVLWE